MEPYIIKKKSDKYFQNVRFSYSDEYCNVLTQVCEVIPSRGRRRRFKESQGKRFEEECDGDYQCEETFRCTPREHRMTWTKSRAWCITKGKKMDPCGVSIGKDGQKIKHHEHCRYEIFLL